MEDKDYTYTELLLTDKDAHIKLMSNIVVQLQSRILNLVNSNVEETSEVAAKTLQNVSDFSQLKLRELCSFLIETKVIDEKVLATALRKGFIEYQTELGKKAEEEIKSIYNRAKLVSELIVDNPEAEEIDNKKQYAEYLNHLLLNKEKIH